MTENGCFKPNPELPFKLAYALSDEGDSFSLNIFITEASEGCKFIPRYYTTKRYVDARLEIQGVKVNIEKIPEFLKEKISEEKFNTILWYLRTGTQSKDPSPFLEIRIKKGVSTEELENLFENLFKVIKDLIDEALSEREKIELVLQKYGIERFAEKSD